MDKTQLDMMVARARRTIVDQTRANTLKNLRGRQQGRFVLFHAAMSFCSQKVRATLAQRGAPFESNEMLILGRREPDGSLVPAENFAPDYVRLRLQGRDTEEIRLVEAYSGISSVFAAGVDPCAVPTLVDLETANVVVDSLRICVHIDAVLPSADRLVPADPVQLANVRRQLNAVDRTPHPGLLYGFHPLDDQRPTPLREAMSSVYEEKLEALNSLLAQNRDDPELVAAYRAKVAKETGGKRVRYDGEFQESLRASTREILFRLDADLRETPYNWLCAINVTLADIFWAVSLVRLRYLGLASLWRDLPAIDAYLERLLGLAAIQDEVISATIASMPRSDYLTTSAT